MRKRIRKFNAQSAMEYLMTYGWAILIIAIILAGLFQLGVFSSSNFTPFAKPGACQVVREGSGLTQTSSLLGECHGLLPQFVAQFNGQTSYVATTYMTTSMSAISVTAWFYLVNPSFGDNPRFVANGHTDTLSDSRGFQLMVNNGGNSGWFDVGSGTANGIAYWSSYQLSAKTWYFYVGTYNQTNGKLYAYINANQIASGSFSGVVSSNVPVGIGYDPAYAGDFADGFISNVQIYNTSLSQAEITSLYTTGIGAAPVRPQNIVGWWPLNGDTKDYSGYGNTGQPNSISFISQWQSGYTAP